MKKTFSWLLICIPFAFLLFIIYAQIDFRYLFDKDYRELAQKFTNAEKNKLLKVSELVDFKWDNVCIVGSYQPIREYVKEAINIDFPILDNYSLEETDLLWLFISGKSVKVIRSSLFITGPYLGNLHKKAYCPDYNKAVLYFAIPDARGFAQSHKRYNISELNFKRTEIYPPCTTNACSFILDEE
jgi:hypothetical protein